jgi:hypothetical protein
MAKLKEITVSISRKISDDNYGSFGVQAAITLEVAEGEDKDELYTASASWLSAKVAGTHKAHGTLSSQPVAKEEPVAQQDVVQATVKEAGLEGDTSEYTNIKGKPHKLCTIHNEWMPQRENEKGKWYSHKDGDDWCKGDD